MIGKELNHVRACVENEGFDYCFINYDDFGQIQDKAFHDLRKAYVDAHKALIDYIEIED